jgi:hypothetical protein
MNNQTTETQAQRSAEAAKKAAKFDEKWARHMANIKRVVREARARLSK